MRAAAEEVAVAGRTEAEEETAEEVEVADCSRRAARRPVWGSRDRPKPSTRCAHHSSGWPVPLRRRSQTSRNVSEQERQRAVIFTSNIYFRRNSKSL